MVDGCGGDSGCVFQRPGIALGSAAHVACGSARGGVTPESPPRPIAAPPVTCFCLATPHSCGEWLEAERTDRRLGVFGFLIYDCKGFASEVSFEAAFVRVNVKRM